MTLPIVIYWLKPSIHIKVFSKNLLLVFKKCLAKNNPKKQTKQTKNLDSKLVTESGNKLGFMTQLF